VVNTVRILESVEHPSVRLTWDPANDFVAGGEGFSAGYLIGHPWIRHVHVKDARMVDMATGLTSWEAIGRGELDFEGLLQALIVDGYAGAVSLETHWHPEGQTREANSRESSIGLLEALNWALETRD
jgi:sugar phosphate isomerase/epimerase